MRVLVTGGAGFIGSHLVDLLVQTGHQVTLMDDFSTGKIKNIEQAASQVQILNADIRDEASLQEASKGVDWIFHLAAMTSVTQSFTMADHYMDVNVLGTESILRVAAKNHVKKVILSSTCAIYGDSQDLPLSESLLPSPKSPYALTKLMNEQYAEYYRQAYGLEYVCLRYFNAYGTRQSASSEYASVIPKFIDQYQKGLSPRIYGDGCQTRDFVHVKDIARANLMAAEAPSQDARVFNIATGLEISLLELLALVSPHFENSPAPQFHPVRKGDILNSVGNIHLAQAKIGYSPIISLESGIQELLQSSRISSDLAYPFGTTK